MSSSENKKVPLLTHAHGLLKSNVLYVSDLDGTLLSPDSAVTSRSSAMLNEAIERGALFTIATARTPATVIELMGQVDMQLPAVVMTGAALFRFTDYSFSRVCFLEEQEVRRLLSLYTQHDVSTFVYTLKENRLDVYHTGKLNAYERSFAEERSHSPIKVFHMDEKGHSPLPSRLDNVLLLFGVQPWERAHKLYERIKHEKIACTPLCYLDAFGPDQGEIEVFGPDTNKAAAVEAIASDVGAGRIVAFGDNVNDLPLFRLADESIAVGNAIPELKSVATDVIEANDKDAVARFILERVKR